MVTATAATAAAVAAAVAHLWVQCKAAALLSHWSVAAWPAAASPLSTLSTLLSSSTLSGLWHHQQHRSISSLVQALARPASAPPPCPSTGSGPGPARYHAPRGEQQEEEEKTEEQHQREKRKRRRWWRSGAAMIAVQRNSSDTQSEQHRLLLLRLTARKAFAFSSPYYVVLCIIGIVAGAALLSRP